MTLMHKVEIRVYAPAQGKALLSPRDRGPGIKGKGNKTPKRRKEPQNPPT